MSTPKTQDSIKVLVFAHVPPPHHGQSYMVQLMIEGFGGDHRHPERHLKLENTSPYQIDCYHVDARVSRNLEDIGDFRPGKFLRLLGHCAQAIWCRWRHGVDIFYYVPAPGKKSALYRDWLVMLFCRPFFKHLILHWHAAGLAKWLETSVLIRSRAVHYNLFKDADLCIVLSNYNRADAQKILPRQIRVVQNGIPDPCPEFECEVAPRRQRRGRWLAKTAAGIPTSPAENQPEGGDPYVVKVVYLAHCMREKGLFDAIAGITAANHKLAAAQSPLSLLLLVAGNFVNAQERTQFEELLAQPGVARCVQVLGFVAGQKKYDLLSQADIFCFPTFYQNENQPVNLIEAMAFGLPIVTTCWRSLPEMFPLGYPGLVEINAPEQIAQALLRLLGKEDGTNCRSLFLSRFNMESHLTGLAEAFHNIGKKAQPDPHSQPPKPARVPR